MRRGFPGRLRQDEEPLLRYVLDARPVQEQLQQALMLLSGFTLLRVTSQPNSRIDDEPVRTTCKFLIAVHEHMGALRIPQAAVHHHHHLRGAESALRLAVAATSLTMDSGDQVYRALVAAVKHLRSSNRLLPGFEMVDLAQSCCAEHGRLAASAPIQS
jgi:hypothetical protein